MPPMIRPKYPKLMDTPPANAAAIGPKKVKDELEKNKIEYKSLDISNPLNMDELIRMGGKEQVPFLMDVDNKVDLYESDDIIEYIKSL